MSIVRRIFPSSIDALRPRLACEITPLGVLAARPGTVAIAGEAQDVLTGFAPLRLGVLAPGLKPPNMPERAVVAAAIRQALDGMGERDRKVTVIVPDAAMRVLLLDFDTLPPKDTDVIPILRFRLRKLVSFEVEDAAISYQLMPSTRQADGLVRAMVAVMPGPVRAEYEDAVREAGYEPGAVLSSSLAALAAVPGDSSSLVVNRNWNAITTAITRGNEVLLYRTLDLGEHGLGGRGLDQELGEAHAISELQQTVSVAMAYFEDTLSQPISHIFSVGPGGAAELTRLLGEETVRVRDLVPSPAMGGTGAMSPGLPPGMLAGVVGALAS